VAAELADFALVEKNKTEFTIFDYARTCYLELSNSKSTPKLTSIHDLKLNSVEDVDRDAHLAIFDVIQALTELVFDLEQRYIREVGKRGVGLPDIK
jgi:hypothetical protein